MLSWISLISALLSWTLVLGGNGPVSYENTQIWSLQIDTPEQTKLLENVFFNDAETIFPYCQPNIKIGQSVEFIISPEKRSKFAEFVEGNGFRKNAIIDNFQSLIKSEKPQPGSQAKLEEDEIDWEQYHRYARIQRWMNRMVADNLDIAQSISPGTSIEQRRISGIKISAKSGLPVIVIESGIHSNEWIAGTTATYIINQLLTSDDPRVVDARNNIEWYIFPIVNPDGFEWAQTNDRLWRKNRRVNENSTCMGVDLNRNYDYQWDAGGGSSNPCSIHYKGPSPQSEPETTVMANFYETVANRTVLFLALHSFGKLILMPWGYKSIPKPREEEHLRVSRAAVRAIATVHGVDDYMIGSSYDVLYQTSGGSRDLMVGHYNVSLAYVIELRDRGPHCFVIPPDQIRPQGEEFFEGLLAMIAEARSLGYFDGDPQTGEPNGALKMFLGYKFEIFLILMQFIAQ